MENKGMEEYKREKKRGEKIGNWKKKKKETGLT